MAMRKFGWSALAASLLALAGAGATQADDTLRLVIPASSAADAALDGGVNTELTRYHGGYRGGYGGYRGGYGYGGYRGGYGYRGYYGGYGGYRGYGYRGYGYGGFYRPFYYGGYGYGGGYPYYSSYYGGGYGGYPYYSGYYGGGYGGYGGYYGGYGAGYYGGGYGAYYGSYPYINYYYPCSGTLVSAAPVVSVQSSSTYVAPAPQVVQPGQAYQPQYAPQVVQPGQSYQPQGVPAQPNGNQTFPYDGGPRAPLPMPGPDANVNPAGTPRPIVPLEGKFVSLPQETTGGIGVVDTASLSPVSWRTVSTTQPAAATSPNRFHYPAYGEQTLPPVNRTRK